MATNIQIRHDSAANWSLHNPILLSGEIGFETSSNFFKIGDGVSRWNSLSYVLPPSQFIPGLFSKIVKQNNQNIVLDSEWYSINELSFEAEANKNYRIQSYIKINTNYYSSFNASFLFGINSPIGSSGILTNEIISNSTRPKGNYLIETDYGTSINLESHAENEYFYFYIDGIVKTSSSGIISLKTKQSRIYPMDFSSTIVSGSYLIYKIE